MKTIGNVIWLVFGGWLAGLAYLAGTVIFFPLAWYLSPFIGYAFWPYGRKAVRLASIERYKAEHENEFSGDLAKGAPGVAKNLRRVLGLVWALSFGWILAIACALFALLNLALCASIILIPVAIANAGAWFKLAKVSLNPFMYRPINSQLADTIEEHFARSKL